MDGNEKRRLSEARSRHRDLPDAEFERLKAESLAMKTPAKPHVFHNSGENEWYTPEPIIEARFHKLCEYQPSSTESNRISPAISTIDMSVGRRAGGRGAVKMTQLRALFSSSVIEHASTQARNIAYELRRVRARKGLYTILACFRAIGRKVL